MDELMTSKLCSQCHHTLSCMKHPVSTQDKKQRKRRTHKGVAVAKVAVAGNTMQKPKKCFGVLCRNHAECRAKYWDRDVSAAINMLALLKSELRGKG